jgi:Fe-S oxidoreductase
MKNLDSGLFYKCVRCGTCKVLNTIYLPACPAGDLFGFENYYPSGKVWIGRGIIEGKIDIKNDAIRRTIFSCTTCGNCTIQCPLSHGKHLLEMYEYLRSQVIKNSSPLKPHNEVIKNIKNYNNPYGEPKRKKGEWLKEISVPNKGDVLYFAGCTSPLTSFLKKIPVFSAEILKTTLGNFKALGEEEICCGSIVLRIGDLESFSEIARKNVEIFKKLGIRKIVTTCAGCYKTLKFDYPRFVHFPFGVLHTIEVLNKHIKKFKRKNVLVTYHDPCHLGRQGGLIEEPRIILNSVASFVEMPRHGINSFCCGAGGGVRIAFPDFALKTAKKRIKEAEGTGAEFLITSCPFCSQNLSPVSSDTSIKVMELVEFLFSD